ncbi:MAG: peptidoglycan DD-metalloendopeptidase family protein [Gammaproteobacteria bacterium]|nr:peptidoglycan DD-metalloendopeptidase family protein [Gammaproteobacteria bacterium]
MVRTPPTVVSLMLAVGLLANNAGASPESKLDTPSVQESDAKLETLRREIGQIRRSLEQSKQHKIRAEKQLRYTELGISKVNRLLQELQQQLDQQQGRLKQLNHTQQTLQHSLSNHTQAIARHVRTSYRLGRQPYIKLLLNQQNPQKVSRALRYYDYYNRARLEQIQRWQNDISSLRQTRNAIVDKNQQLQALQEERLKEKQHIGQLHVQRAQSLLAYRKEFDEKKLDLEKLLQNEQELLNLVQTIRIQPPDLQQRPFDQLKGQLPWPTIGNLKARFGSSRHIGDLKWQGVLIGSKSGQAVRAIAAGRIAYSDWLRGFGLLVILDHGNGYMSLYGHNESLYKDTGTWVQPSEVIASVGSSGGQQSSGLYFELRHKGKPVNPAKWLKNP